jgi:hypothetical protein
LKRKRKCVPKTTRERLENDQKTTRNDPKVPKNDQEEMPGEAKNINYLNSEEPYEAKNINYLNSEKPGEAKNMNYITNNSNNLNNKTTFCENSDIESSTSKKWTCMYCHKTFAHNSSWHKHMRLRCPVLKSKLVAENLKLKQELDKLKSLQSAAKQTIQHNTTNNTTTHNNNTTNNVVNNIQNINNIQLPDGIWSRKLYRVIVHLMSKAKGDRFSPGEISFYEAFQKTLSVAFFHPESPVYNTVQMLGRKEAWAKHHGKIVQKNTLLKKINVQHYERLIEIMKADNERFRKELPPAPVVQKWMEVNNEIIRNIKKYDPCQKKMIRDTEEVFRTKSLIDDFNICVQEVKKADRMDRDIAYSQARDAQRVLNER